MFRNRRLYRAAAGLSVAIPLAFITQVIAGTHYHSAFEEPPTFSSSGGKLNLMVIAKAIPNTYFSDLTPGTPMAWVYEMCVKDPASSAWETLSCQDSTAASLPGTVARNGGPRLALQPGDLLKIRFVNRLPASTGAAAFANTATDPLLLYNPTNLHTHGLIVEPRTPTAARDSYGDTIYVLNFPTANFAVDGGAALSSVLGATPAQVVAAPNNLAIAIAPEGPPDTSPVSGKGLNGLPHQHADVLPDVVDYEINLPANHPSGTYILHPHPHGPTANQMQAGLSAMIEVQDVYHRTCNDRTCTSPIPNITARHMILDDTQIDPNGNLMTEINSSFCSQTGTSTTNNGYCVGDPTGPNGQSLGKWFFAVSSQVYPAVSVTSANGEIWNLSGNQGNATYQLSLMDNTTGKPMAIQIISVDGIAINTASYQQLPNDVVRLAGAKFHLANCGTAAPRVSQPAVCADAITMMSSSRVEIWVTHRDSNGNVTPTSGPVSATLKTSNYQTGNPIYSFGDSWPAINLVDVTFNQPQTSRPVINVKSNPLFGPNGALTTSFTPQYQVPAVDYANNPPNNFCPILGPNQYRRIYYGAPPGTQGQGLGLGWEIIQYDPTTGNKTPVPGTRHDVASFDYDTTEPVCIQLDANNKPVAEVWEIVDLAPEAHNFHIHQNKFRVVDISQTNQASPYFTAVLTNREAFGHVQTTSMDNIPLAPSIPTGRLTTQTFINQGGCLIGDVWAGNCTIAPVQLEMPFKFAGDLVYHCHILSHEDLGMMNKIRVATNP